jgi:hypothetical protein
MNKHGEFLYIQGDFWVSRRYKNFCNFCNLIVTPLEGSSVCSRSEHRVGSSRERFGQQLPALTAADQRYTSYKYTTRLYRRSWNVILWAEHISTGDFCRHRVLYLLSARTLPRLCRSSTSKYVMPVHFLESAVGERESESSIS